MPKDDVFSQCTFVFEAGENLGFLAAKLGQALYDNKPAPLKILVACPPGLKAKTLTKLSAIPHKVEVLEVNGLCHDLPAHLPTPFFAYLPANAPYCPPYLENLEKADTQRPFVRPWIPPVSISDTEWARLVYMAFGWISTPALLQLPLGNQRSIDLRDLERVSQKNGFYLSYLTAPAGPPATPKTPGARPPKLTPRSKILALVPHYDCLDWLGQCLDSLVHQTRPPDAIAVLDDASPVSPMEIMRGFKGVTLLRAAENSGPYRMLQTVIDRTDFDGYMFQDADDWSVVDRLENLLAEAERVGAEWIGTQEFMYFEDSIHVLRYPLDLNSTPQASIRHPFCYPSSVISRDFLKRLGGFASGLKFSGDFELLTRAVWAGKVANLNEYGYFRRIRKNSLITSEATGLASLARREVDSQIEKRKAENLARVIKGGVPSLEPLKTAAPLSFEHLAGPPLIN